MQTMLDPVSLKEINAFVEFGEGKEKFQYLSSGKNADVFKFENVAVKIFNKNAKDTNDPFVLSNLGHSEFYPKLFHFEHKKFMVMELVDGKTIYDIEGKENLLLKDYEKELYQAYLDAQKVGLFSNDVHLNNIMISYDGKIKIVDVGRFTNIPTTKE